MKIKFIKALWGMESVPAPEALRRIKEAGYDGFETPSFAWKDHASLDRHGMDFIAMIFPMSLDEFKRGVDESLAMGPTKINVHAGKDWWCIDEGSLFFEGALKVQAPVPICFETHRGRLLHEPRTTLDYLRRFPDLKITADFSHWTCVCESMLHDQAEAVDLAIKHVHHVHARVGHEEGPQVSDPRAPEWQGHVARFEQLWDAMKAAHEARGAAEMTVDVEFGPPHYLHTLPFTNVPVADLWDICKYMADRLRKRWN